MTDEKEDEGIIVPYGEVEQDNEFEVVEKGWEGETPLPMMLLDRERREKLGLEVGDVVITKIAKGERKIPAVVRKQFQRYVKKGAVAMVNKSLSNILGINVEETIKIVGVVDEKHRAEVFKPIRGEIREQIISQARTQQSQH